MRTASGIGDDGGSGGSGGAWRQRSVWVRARRRRTMVRLVGGTSSSSSSSSSLCQWCGCVRARCARNARAAVSWRICDTTRPDATRHDSTRRDATRLDSTRRNAAIGGRRSMAAVEGGGARGVDLGRWRGCGNGGSGGARRQRSAWVRTRAGGGQWCDLSAGCRLQPRSSLHSIFPPFAALVCCVPPLSSGRGLGVWWRPNTPHARPVMRDRAIRRQCRHGM